MDQMRWWFMVDRRHWVAKGSPEKALADAMGHKNSPWEREKDEQGFKVLTKCFNGCCSSEYGLMMKSSGGGEVRSVRGDLQHGKAKLDEAMGHGGRWQGSDTLL
jgi:hypothetical protein